MTAASWPVRGRHPAPQPDGGQRHGRAPRATQPRGPESHPAGELVVTGPAGSEADPPPEAGHRPRVEPQLAGGVAREDVGLTVCHRGQPACQSCSGRSSPSRSKAAGERPTALPGPGCSHSWPVLARRAIRSFFHSALMSLSCVRGKARAGVGVCAGHVRSQSMTGVGSPPLDSCAAPPDTPALEHRAVAVTSRADSCGRAGGWTYGSDMPQPGSGGFGGTGGVVLGPVADVGHDTSWERSSSVNVSTALGRPVLAMPQPKLIGRISGARH